MLDVRRLRVLCAVADHPTLSAAAEALSYTPSAVSQSIVALEREVGARLLHRGPRGVQLTETGRTLVDHARPIIAGLHAAEASLADLAGGQPGVLHLGSFATAGATLLPEAIAAFRERLPQVRLTLTQVDPDQAMARLRAGAVDLIITADAEAGVVDDVEIVELLDDPLFAVLPLDHELAAAPAVRLEDLAAETWVDTPAASEARRLLLRVCSVAGYIPRVAFESDDYATVIRLVATGVGVALVPGLALDDRPSDVAVLPVAGAPVTRRVVAGVHAPAYRGPAASGMLAILQEVAAERVARAAAATQGT